MLDIIDNCLTDEEINSIEEIFSKAVFTYRETTNSVWYDSSEYTMFHKENIVPTSQFVAVLIAEGRNIQEECAKALLPLCQQIDKYMEKHNLKFIQAWRVKCNVTHPNPMYSDNSHDEPHCDSVFNEGDMYSLSVIYYVNDSDGDTYIHVDEENVRITPKRGRFVVFPSHTPHAANTPRKFPVRKVINFVLDVGKNEPPSPKE